MIINRSKEKVLAHDLRVCRSVFGKAQGLMFSKKIKDFGLVFEFGSERKRSLHNLFVFFPIDVLFLNENMEVVEIKRDFKPFTFYFPKQKSKYIIELPAGTIPRTNSEMGDIINFK